MDTANDLDEPGAVAPAVENEKPSCHGCRKRKLKCSRELPTCAHCRRLDAPCAYGDRKNKPGVKSGAIEGLSRRIETLENALLQRDADGNGTGSGSNRNGDGTPGGVLRLLSTLCVELCKHNNSLRQPRTPDPPTGPPPSSPEARRAAIQPADMASPAGSVTWQWQSQYGHNHDQSTLSQSRKRRRLDSCSNVAAEPQLPLEDTSSSLPSPDLLEDIVDVYFAAIQPWLPILHETRFRDRIRDPGQSPHLHVVVHAMVVCALRFAHPDAHGLSPAQVEAMTKRSRSTVILTAMDSLAVENLQALIMIAFNDIGNGEASKAWSLIGSLTRTVEYLQLSVEPVNHDTQPLLKPLVSLPPARTWVEEEERRRVFWNIFNLDRFCSVATGWNTSLTADDVHRRLPADGGCWHKAEAVTTPYFGIWDRSSARIGNSIAFLPAHYSSSRSDQEAQPTEPDEPQSSPATVRNVAPPDMSTVGAFAYCIEATESLSRVTTFFLQQRINFHDRREVSSWLTRFKELDLRLVHWKMFLPRKWKDSNISRLPTLINMDPNLTLAHATHNTSMILLHQRVAYPPADWANIVKLPSLCSAETCQNAAIETQNITSKYLKYTTAPGPVANQFAFCAFVAARVLLVHSRYYGSELPQALWLLVDGLDEMAKRWLGAGARAPRDHPDGSSASQRGQHRCLAETYADHLRDLHRRCVADLSFSVDVLGYSTVISNLNSPSHRQPQPQHISQQPQEPQPYHTTYPQTAQNVGSNNGMLPLLDQPIAATAGAGRFPGSQQADAHMNGSPNDAGPAPAVDTPMQPMQYTTPPTDDELSNISYMLLDQRFLDMDRVISLDNMMFSTGIGSAAHTMGDGSISLAGSNSGEAYSVP